jgi:hypothetical protein
MLRSRVFSGLHKRRCVWRCRSGTILQHLLWWDFRLSKALDPTALHKCISSTCFGTQIRQGSGWVFDTCLSPIINEKTYLHPIDHLDHRLVYERNLNDRVSWAEGSPEFCRSNEQFFLLIECEID